MSGKYALIIGNTEYTDSGLAQLTAPGKDAEDFARVLKSQDICDFDDVKISINQPSSSVIETIDEFFDQKKPDDLLILYFSGHGVKDEIGSLYLAFKNTVRSRLRSTAIKSDYIREAMDQSRSKRQVLILDCCNSGAFPQGTKAEIGGAMGMSKAFQGYGRFVLTASDATQFAWEGDKVIGETDNSLFTHFLVKGLEGEADSDGDGKISVDELYDYAYEQVSRVTPKQTPTKSSSKQEGEIILRENMRIEDIKPIALSDDLICEIEDLRPYVREMAVQKLARILKGKNIGLARSAKEALERIATEDDSRRVSQIAAQALEFIHQKEREEEEEERKAREEAQRLAMLKAEEEQQARKKAETQKKAETERKAKEEAQRLAAQKSEKKRLARERVERNFAQIRSKLVQLLAHGKVEGNILLNYLQNISKNKSKIYISFCLAILLVSIISFYLYQRIDGSTLFFSGISGGYTNIYFFDGKTPIKITRDETGIENWSPVFTPFGELYFTSNRDGKTEIYRMKGKQAQKVTDTPNPYASWGPAFDSFGRLYFTSNRDGKIEIYYMNGNQAQKVTDTPNPYASWGPAFDSFGRLYFTSNRDGETEIYRIKGNQAQKMTDTPDPYASWGPAFDSFGRLYFTSTRDGSVEIYRRKDDGSNEQVTHTPPPGGSWAPVFSGNNLYFTSNRNNRNEVFLLDDAKAITIFSIENWTKPMDERYPLHNP
jgi:Tol biopolymer transport system component